MINLADFFITKTLVPIQSIDIFIKTQYINNLVRQSTGINPSKEIISPQKLGRALERYPLVKKNKMVGGIWILQQSW